METAEGTAGQQTMDIHTTSHNQESSKVPLLPTAEDENAEEGNSTGRLVYCVLAFEIKHYLVIKSILHLTQKRKVH